ncbi:MAG: hypothetical protein JWN16_138 [Alphaproteobacteria bacterium]|nr:hypothetical protein [Alphaproteobacteria bacterium]
MDHSSLMTSVLIVVIAAGAYLLRDAIRTWLTKGISHRFDQQIETLRADLRAKEEKIATLRQNALSGASKRRESLDKRRQEAVDNLWADVTSLGRLKLASKYMETINFEESAKLVGGNANARRFFETIGKTINLEKMPRIEAAKERPFLSEKAWALYSAYSAILYYAVMQIKTLEIGEDASKLLNHKNIDDLLRAALPHQAVNLEKFGTSFCHFCVDELEQALLKALKDDLEGNKASEEDMQNSAQILRASENIMATLDNTANQS